MSGKAASGVWRAACGVRHAAYGMWGVIMQVESRKTGRNPESVAIRDHDKNDGVEILKSIEEEYLCLLFVFWV